MNKKNLWMALGVAVLAGASGLTYYFWPAKETAPTVAGGGGRRGMDGAGRPVPVVTASARTGEIDVTLTAIGTVTAKNTVTVKPRVDGQLIRVSFREGQMVSAGEVLGEIDPRPFQVVLEQANGQLARDQAQLTNALVDQQRYQILMAKDSIARQQLEAQDALVRQFQGAVQSDHGQVNGAKLQLGFTRITAPVSGRLGLRQVDVGNMVRASDATGLVVITQTQPINAIFSIPADSVGVVAARLQSGGTLPVEAWDRESKVKLASGKLLTIDNQIDTTTGTVKLKAEFTNADNSLFPNQFVNIRLLVETRQGAVLIPMAAIQRGTQGTFVYTVNPEEKTVALRPVRLGATTAEIVAIEKGVAPGDMVVIDGADKLRAGGKVEIITAAVREAAGKAPPGGGRRKGPPSGSGESPASTPPAATSEAAPTVAPSAKMGHPGKPSASAPSAAPPPAETVPPTAPAAPPAAAAPPSPAGGDAGAERPRWMDRLPPEIAEKVAKMSPEERRAWIQKRREERAKQNDGSN